LILRDYQARLKADLAVSTSRATLGVLSTGGGKTPIMASIATDEPGPVLIAAHRRRLIQQASAKLREFGTDHGIIAPGHPMTNHRVQVGSIQTITRRLHLLPQFALIMPDEAHHCISAAWEALFAAQLQARINGFTATPERLDSRGLGEVFGSMVLGPSIAELIAGGYLVKPRVFGPEGGGPDLSGVRTLAGEYHPGDVAQVMGKPSIIGNAAYHYESYAPGKRAIGFCSSVAEAERVAACFRAEGWRFKSIHGGMSLDEQNDLLARLESGGLHGLMSCNLVDEGLDIPAVEAIIDLAPSKSLGRCMQRWGRAGRPVYAPGFPTNTAMERRLAIAASGKPRSIILDCAGNVLDRHGMPDQVRTWSLDSGKRRPGHNVRVVQCPECYACHPPAPKCPECGFDYPTAVKPRRGAKFVDGNLSELTAEDIRLTTAPLKELLRGATREALERVADARGYSPKWVDLQMSFRNRRGPRTTAAQDFAA
jgi:superfamily II DNA or RNA helicase